MTLTPDDIERQVFAQEFRGYDRNEVDQFLDRISEVVKDLVRERDALAGRVEAAERDAGARIAAAESRAADIEVRSGEALEAERLLKRTLVMAQRTADETVAEARAQADQTVAEARAQVEHALEEARASVDDAERRAADLVGEARARAEETLAEAYRQAEDLVGDARREADELLADARARALHERETSRAEAERVRRAVADLARFRDIYRDQVRAVIAEQLAMIERAGDIPELPRQLEDLAAVADPSSRTSPQNYRDLELELDDAGGAVVAADRSGRDH
ncbi:hypothetical protein BH23ACT7_BH23ACT7_28020 [soil metagenome]